VSEVIVIFPQLKTEHGIDVTRPGLNLWMDAGIFPPARRISANRIGWLLSDIEKFKATRPTSYEPPPQLWPRRERPVEPPKASKKPVGRPAGSRVVTGADGRRRLVRREELGVADAA
jgi:predicted DNA-binding transcriptional regulator AlpA